MHLEELVAETRGIQSECLQIVQGLSGSPAALSPKYFYDKKGSALFEDITRLHEYYPTRTENAIMECNAEAIAKAIGEGGTLIELGAGNCQKGGALCRMVRAKHYVAVDISEDFLITALSELRPTCPDVSMHHLVADLTSDFSLPRAIPMARRMLYYPGSSIGNFDPSQARSLLAKMRSFLDEDGALLVGVDLVKDETVLNAAYNDEEGVTAAFNLNVLQHINRLIGSDFDPQKWRHKAFFNREQSRIEMHLEALVGQDVRLPGAVRHFDRGERIHTENSYKYQLAQFLELLADVGLCRTDVWTDKQSWFAVVLARP